MFDVAFSELIVIAVVALIVIGPEKLPKVARTLGALVGRMQRYVAQVKEEVNREVRFQELQQLQQEIQEAANNMTAEWRGKPVWIIHRTDEMTADLAKHNDQLSDPACDVVSQQPAYCKNASRSLKPNLAVIVGICTHLGCSPSAKLQKGGDMGDSWDGGFFCPCHGSKFDLAGRVFKGSPAPINLVVPPHKYLADNTILIGVDTEEKA